MRASELLGRTAHDLDGRPLGRIADLLTRPVPGEEGVHYLHSVLVTPRWRGRLFGYERPGVQGPWIVERLAGRLHRGTREIPLDEIRLEPRVDV